MRPCPFGASGKRKRLLGLRLSEVYRKIAGCPEKLWEEYFKLHQDLGKVVL